MVFLVGYLDAAVVLTLVYHRLSSVAVPVQAVTATSLSVVDQNKTLAVRYLGDNFDFLSNVAPIKAAAILVAWPVTVALCAGSGDLWSLASCVAATVGTTLFTVGVLGESYAASRL